MCCTAGVRCVCCGTEGQNNTSHSSYSSSPTHQRVIWTLLPRNQLSVSLIISLIHSLSHTLFLEAAICSSYLKAPRSHSSPRPAPIHYQSPYAISYTSLFSLCWLSSAPSCVSSSRRSQTTRDGTFGGGEGFVLLILVKEINDLRSSCVINFITSFRIIFFLFLLSSYFEVLPHLHCRWCSYFLSVDY